MLVSIAIAAAIVAIASGLLLAYGLTRDGVYPGVSIGGVEVGGLSRDQVAERLTVRVADASDATLALRAEGQTWTVPLASLGVTFDAEASATRAYDYGRSGNLWTDSRDWLTTLGGGHDIPVAFTLNDQAVVAALQQISPAVTRAARDAAYDTDASGNLVVTPSASGVGIDVPATLRGVRESIGSLGLEPVDVVTVETHPMVTEADLRSGLDQAQDLAGGPFTLEHGEARWEIPGEALRGMLAVEKQGKRVALTPRPDLLATYIGPLADQVAVPSKDPTVEWDGTRFNVVPGQSGEALDVDATVQSVTAAWASGERRAEIVTRPLPGGLPDDSASAAAERANALVVNPPVLTWPDGRLELTTEQVASVLRFDSSKADQQSITVSVDDDALSALLEELRTAIEIPARDADLRYLGGQVTVVSAEQRGLALDVEASVPAVADAILAQAGSVEVVTRPVDPVVTSASAGGIVIRDLLGSARTSYAGSIDNRRQNVELAVERANGALVPPGGTYSFTDSVGNVDLESGYAVGYGIVGASNGSVSTVPSVGGGICQVSTTLFQAAFWAGMPIVERNWHLYWIPSYGQPPSGLTGLDATVDTDYGLDLKFKNTTNDWLAIIAKADGQWVTFEVWGTNPGWQVTVEGPVVTNIVPADTTMQYRESDQLPAGQSVLVEHAEDGFDVSIHRTVTQDGQTIDDLTLTSHYVPSANVTLVGTQ